MEQKVKSFWDRPEGKTGGFMMIGIIAGLGILLYHLLPKIIILLQNTLYAVGLGVGLFAIITILLDKNFRNGVWFLYKQVMRMFTGFVIELNPIAILKDYIQKMKDRRVDMNDKMGLVNGQKVKLAKKIQANQEGMIKALNIAKMAEAKQDEGEIVVQTNQVGRLKASNSRLEPLLKKLDDLYDFLIKLYKASDLIIRDKEAEIELFESEYIATKEATSAIKLVKSIFNGAEDEMYKQAYDFVIEEISNQLGDIDNFMRSTESMIKSLEYEQGSNTSEGMKMLEEFKQSDFTFLLNRNSGKVPNSPEKILIPKTATNKQSGSGFANLLDD